MKKLFILPVCIVIGGMLLFDSCTKTGPQGPSGTNGTAGPVLYGTITGNVIMTNQYGTAVTNDYTGGYIVLKNASTNATVDSVFADSLGQYSIPNVATGTYNMYCLYAGYGLNFHQNLQFTGGGALLVDNKIAAIPNFNVTTAVDSLGTVKKNLGYLFVSGTIPADNNGARTILVFVGNSSNTSSNPEYYSFVTSKIIPQDSTVYSVTIPLNTIFTNGFAYGSPVYFAVYGAANNYTYGDYTNYTYGQLVYTPLSPTAVNASPAPLTLP